MRTSQIRSELVWKCDAPGCSQIAEMPTLFSDENAWPRGWTNIMGRELCPAHSFEAISHAAASYTTAREWHCATSELGHNWGHPNDKGMAQCLNCSKEIQWDE